MGREAQQTTTARPVTYSGIGLHTGESCAVSLLPAEPDAGVVFVREGAVIPAVAGNVVDTGRGTTLGGRAPGGPFQIGGVEHLMAALYGLGVDNVRAAVEGPELPAGDGSGLEWVRLLRRAGRRGLGVARRMARLNRAVWAGEGASWAMALPGGAGLALAVGVEYEHTVAGRQSLWMKLSAARFAKELAPARTFAMAEELEALRAMGLSKGGSELNAFAVGRDSYSGPLRFADEVVRHKALDVLGDVALCGSRLEGQVVAVRPSHRVNVELARKLRELFQREGCG